MALVENQTCSTRSAAAVRRIDPTLKVEETPSRSSATRPVVARRHSRCSRLRPVPSSCLLMSSVSSRRWQPRSRAAGSPHATRRARSASPVRRATAASESAPRCLCTTRWATPSGSQAAEPVHQDVVQGAPCRRGSAGSTRCRRSAGRRAPRRAPRPRTFASPAAAALAAQRARARSFTSTAHTVAPGRPPGEGAGDGPVAAPEVEQGARRSAAGRAPRAAAASCRDRRRWGRRRRGRWRA